MIGSTVGSAVTALFVPGDRPDRFAKATASGADVVIIDLEDAVAPEAKAAALAAVVEALSAPESVRALVRVNAVGSATYEGEIAALHALANQPGHGLEGIMIPKAEDPDAVRRIGEAMPAGLDLVPLIESAAGLVRAFELASVPGVTRLAFGAIDFALDIDAEGIDRVLDYARAQLVVASRAAGVAAPLDSPSVDIRDLERVGAAARTARSFGFGGKLCIHPAQLNDVAAAFAPTAEEVAWAQRVIGSAGGAVQLDGEMIDRPVTERASRILARAGLR